MKKSIAILFCLVWFSSGAVAQVLISEIMYHPFEEGLFDAAGNPRFDLSEEVHEFIEIHNAGSEAAALNGWRLKGAVDYNFPEGTVIAPKAFLVIAKNKERLAALPAYGLTEASLFGPYNGQLSNSGELLRLENGKGVLMDSVEYSPAFPWPISADKFGADPEFTGINHMLYNFRGRSLERLSYKDDSNDPANWIASPVPGEPSPGKANSVTAEELPPIVTAFQVLPTNGDVFVRKTIPVKIEATFSKLQVANPSIEFFDDSINLTNETKTILSMQRSPDSPFTFSAMLPGKNDRILVRFRFRCDINQIGTPISPRKEDPYQWHAYFVSPVRVTANSVNDLLISTANLARMQQNLADNPNLGFIPRAGAIPNGNWNKMVPAVLVRDGVVFDVITRYNGSFFRRSLERQSYKIDFPDYRQLDGQSTILMTDKDYMSVVGLKLFEEAGLPSSKTEWSDLYVNSNARLVRLQIEEHDRRMLRNYHEEQAVKNGGEPDVPGRIFKSSGILNNVGPYGRGDGSVLPPVANFNSQQRYEWVYSSKNDDWRGYKGFADMIAGLKAARGANPAANAAKIKAFLLANFDVDKSLTYIAVRNWMSTWDDTVHNYYIWQQSNGKYSFLPWDFDADMGQMDLSSATKSIYRGENGNADNTAGHGDMIFKDSFFKAFKAEYNKKLFFLNNTVLHPDNVRAMGLNYVNVTNFATARYTYVNGAVNLGSFQKPNQPVALSLGQGLSALPPARLIASEYSHSAAVDPAHAKTLWRIANRNEQVVFSVTSTDDLTSLEVPFDKLIFGQTYSWQCIYIDETGTPSIPSEKSYFRFGGDSKRRQFVQFDGAEWKYNQSGSNLGTSWRALAYDDSTWQTGAQPIGVGTVVDGPVPRTALTVGKTTYYFRKTFEFNGSPSQAFCLIQLLADDGAVVYLNNKEMMRTNLPGTAISYNTFANKLVGNPAPSPVVTFHGANLVGGANIIAVEVHQNTTASADVMFGLGFDITYDDGPGMISLNEVMVYSDKPAASLAVNELTSFIELAASGAQVDLSGFALTDDPKTPSKFVFPQGTILEPFSFLVVNCDGKAQGPGFHASLKLNKDGGAVSLFKPTAAGYVLHDHIAFGVQAANYSIGRTPSVTGAWNLGQPTPGKENTRQSAGLLTTIKINEWMADPASGNDWLELYNSSSALPVDLSDSYLSDSANNLRLSKIPALSFVGPNRTALFFASENIPAGPNHLNFKLSGDGESIFLSNSSGVSAQTASFTRQTRGVSQGRLPDGGALIAGFQATSSPGVSNYKPLEGIRFNEVISNPMFPQESAIELHNMSDAALDISNWWLSDDESNLQKFQVQAGAIIPANGFYMVYGFQFNNPENAPKAFNLTPAGGELFLSGVTSTGTLNGNRARLKYSAVRLGQSQGIPANSSSQRFAPLQRSTLGNDVAGSLQEFRQGAGAANTPASIPDLVISEIMYHPTDLPGGLDNSDDEFVELQNISPFAITLTSSELIATGWALFETSISSREAIVLAPGEYLLLVTFNPETTPAKLASFMTKYKVPQSAKIFGPVTRKLNNSEDLVQVSQPVLLGQQLAFLPIDEVLYRDAAPWPGQPDGNGPSLQRKNLHLPGNDFSNWAAANPTPGKGNYVDNDGDGMADAWELANQLDPTVSSDAALDSDGDGLTNLAEFRTQLDPHNASEKLSVSLVRTIDGTMQLRFNSKAGLVYIVDSAESLTGPWSPAFSFRADEAEAAFEIPDSQKGPAGFYRVRVP